MKARSTQRLPLTDLVPDPDQPRSVFSEESLQQLAQTLVTGQLQPVLAYRKEGQLLILDGERRWRAARLAKLSSIEVIEVDAPTPAEAMQQALTVNVQREDLNGIDAARSIARFQELTGWPAAKVAAELGLSPAKISRLLALLRLPESVQELVLSGALSPSVAYQIVQVADPAEQERLAAEAVAGGLSRDAVAGRRKAKACTGQGRRSSPRVVARLEGERTVTMAGAGLDSLDALIEWLEELLGKARKARPRGMELSTFISLLSDQAKAKSPGKDSTAKGGA